MESDCTSKDEEKWKTLLSCKRLYKKSIICSKNLKLIYLKDVTT